MTTKHEWQLQRMGGYNVPLFTDCSFYLIDLAKGFQWGMTALSFMYYMKTSQDNSIEHSVEKTSQKHGTELTE